VTAGTFREVCQYFADLFSSAGGLRWKKHENKRIGSMRARQRGVVPRVPDGTRQRIIVLDNLASQETICTALFCLTVYAIDDVMQPRGGCSGCECKFSY